MNKWYKCPNCGKKLVKYDKDGNYTEVEQNYTRKEN